MRDPMSKYPISDDTRFFLTPAGLAALNAEPAARRPSRKCRLVRGLAAKRTTMLTPTRPIHPASTSTKG